MAYDRELQLAQEAALAAGKIQLAGRGRTLAVERKTDASPVTEVDRRCEEAIRTALLDAFPLDGFLGEEGGHADGSSGRTWIVDPLDGTRPYIRGIPTYSVLIALEDGGCPAVGVIHLPALQETYWAATDHGAFLNGSPIRVSGTASLAEATGTALGFVEKYDLREGRRLCELMQQWEYTYGFMDAYAYGCVASGRLDVSVNLLDKAWDCAAAACIVSEAGGRFSDLSGKESVHSGNVVLSNGLLHDEVIRFLAGEPGR
jgi:histidinol phosphatase-like enzyme (inositol monophosphatase family)